MRFHKGNDGWGRGSYSIPEYAVAGCSYTGNASDSPCPESVVREETQCLRAELRRAGIPARLRSTASGNCCMVKVWVVVTGKNYSQAVDITLRWLTENKHTTRLIHDAA